MAVWKVQTCTMHREHLGLREPTGKLLTLYFPQLVSPASLPAFPPAAPRPGASRWTRARCATPSPSHRHPRAAERPAAAGLQRSPPEPPARTAAAETRPRACPSSPGRGKMRDRRPGGRRGAPAPPHAPPARAAATGTPPPSCAAPPHSAPAAPEEPRPP